ncbi:SDR family NAD(P)-dependent oxidoreductase [Streptomyces sp. PRB2-1]|uniref:SDR family NAD(P)-dependent oxidoreductase n=1 Tax=Actinacidiphila epipremni TaxID=2053013 RepID=A0ABX0ZM40_9ACTN|nr:type I polyketide synthase [Actinacidiphila epipremni]NJP44346.1 SDR family NAD(P)-dependent oxidoreductase [Actinacidiphila epipremni]
MADEKELVDYLRRLAADLHDTRRQLRENEDRAREPIAIVGMACRYPGDVSSPDDLWRLVATGGDGIGPAPDDRGWQVMTDTGAAGAGAQALREGGFLHGATRFDAGFFGISPREALVMDPQQRIALEAAWEAVEHAGIDATRLRGSRTGVFLGVASADYVSVAQRMPELAKGYMMTGIGTSVVSGRVSYVLGLEGPAVTVDTACSSSLVALHLAAQALRSGECTLALAGGVTVMSTPGVFVDFSKQSGLAPDGRCKAFGGAADGTGFAEGVGMLVVERLSDARRNGHRVLAVVRGSAINQDGASNGLTAPNGPSQQRVIRQALANARVPAAEIDAVEAHGTGTVLGDPIEAQALLATYGQERPAERPLWLGSLKSNIGHAQAAAGVGGVIKMVMAMRHGVLPQSLHIDEPTPHVEWDTGAVALLTEAREWEAAEGRPRRAGVSSFGISGTNAHIILEEATEPEPAEGEESAAPAAGTPAGGVVPWVLSARSEPALRGQAERLLAAVGGAGAGGAADAAAFDGGRLVDTAWSLAGGRAALEHRAVVVGGFDRLTAGLAALAGGEPAAQVVSGVTGTVGKTVFVFPGQGSQWLGMAAGLLESSPVFAERMRECAAVLSEFADWSLLEVLEDEAALKRVDVIQPVLWAVMVSLAAVWRSVGVEPQAVLGHSQGEIAAAAVSGVLSLRDAAKVVALRSKAIIALSGLGGMASVAQPQELVRERIAAWDGKLSVAAVNGTASTVVSGEVGALEELLAACEADDVRARRIDVDYASHSAQVETIREDLARLLAGIEPRRAEVPFYSTVTGGWVTGTELDATYWYTNLRETVGFEPAVRALLGEAFWTYVECSAHPVLAMAVQETAEDAGIDIVGVGTLRRGEGGWDRFLTSAAEAYVRGVAVDWPSLLPGGAHVDLPTYAFQHERYWPKGGAPGNATGLGLRSTRHPLLGAATSLAGSDGVLLTGRVSLQSAPWLADHRVGGRALMPGTAFVDLAVRAGDEVGCDVVEELTLQAPLVFPEQGGIRLQIVVEGPDEAGRRPFGIHAQTGDDEPWTRHATGVLATGARSTTLGVDSWPPAEAEALDTAGVYDGFAAMEIGYGPLFRGLRKAWRLGDDIIAEVELPGEAGNFALHPALLDAALHPMVLGVVETDTDAPGPWLPFAWRNVAVHATGATALRVRLAPAGPNAVALTVADAGNALVASVESLVVRPLAEAGDDAGPAAHRRSLFRVDWQPLPADKGALPVSAAVVGDPGLAVSGALGMLPHPDLAALRESVAAGTPAPDAVLVPCPAPAEGELPQRVRESVTAALELVKEWLADEAFADSRLVLLTRGAVEDPARDGAAPEDLPGAALWGLVRSAQTENPGRVVLLDTDGTQGSFDALRTALATDEPQLALREGTAYVPRLVRAELPDTPADTGSWDPDGTVLVTGATGTLGRTVARHLVADRGVRHLLLLSRSGAEAPGAAELAEELIALGASVDFAACDAADRDQLAAALALIPADRPLRGVVHAAGALADGVLGSLTAERLEPVLRPKVDAAVHLDELTRDADLTAFVLFSSLAGTVGAAGQANYAAANAFVDALARRRATQGRPAVALAWGMWSRLSGLTGRLDDADLARMARSGLVGLSDEDGLALLDASVASGQPALVPAGLDLSALRAAAAATGALPALFRALVRMPNRRTVEAASAAADTLLDDLAAATESDRPRIVLDVIRSQVAAVLGYAGPSAVDTARPFREIGFDSLTAVEFRNRLSRATGLRLPATLVFDYPTATVLADHLLQHVTGGTATARPAAAVHTAGSDEPIAIVGMSCRFPGGVDSPDALWQLVADGVDAMSGFPTDRNWAVPAPDTAGYTPQGGFLYDAAEFDAALFGISPREALAMDPQHRLFLEAAWEAVERAGIDATTLRGSDTGVFGGLMYHDYLAQLAHVPADAAGFIGTGTSGGVLSGRVAYTFGFEGPAVTVDTACSSSLVALHLAVQALRSGECSLALAGGVTVLSTPGAFADFGRQGGLSHNGRCKSFAGAADGTGWGEGVGVLLVERLSDARRNGHDVLAVVRGTGVNQDGASNGLTAPNGPAQQRLIRHTLAQARLTADQVDVVEGHGTGTTLGDPIEAQALLATYGQGRPADRPLLLGSIKSNIGHTQGAAGVAGVIKMVMAIRNGVAPRTLHVDEPSPHVDWSEGAVRLLTEAEPWPETGRPRRAAVSSFGISGTNAHAIIEQAPPTPEPAAAERPAAAGPVPWLLSARTPAALAGQARALLAHVGADQDADVRDIGYSLAVTRARFKHRAAVVGTDHAAMLRTLAELADGGSPAEAPRGTADPGRTAFLFTGQGSQRAGMGRELHAAQPVFAASFDECCRLLGLDPAVVLDGAGDLDRTGTTQRALFALEVALFRLLESWGIRPDLVAGHSVGEIAAAHVAGVLSLPDACALVEARGRLMEALPEGGAMVSVRAAEQTVRPLLDGLEGVDVAAVNGPASVVISGAAEAVHAVAARLAEQGVRTRQLTVSHAFHSPLMDPMLDDFRAVAEGLSYAPPRLTVVSALTGAVAGDDIRTPGHWVRHVRDTVRFADAVAALAAEGARTFVELGPDGVLTAMVRDALAGTGERVTAVPVLRRDRTEAASVAGALAQLHACGADPDWTAVFAGTGARRVPLPPYAFQRERYWPTPAGGAAASYPGAGSGADDAGFWTAVEAGDPAALAKLLQADGDRGELAAVLPLLAAWRRRSREQAAATANTQAAPAAPAADEGPALRERLRALPPHERLELLTSVVVAETATVLGHTGSGAVEAGSEFFDLGMSSLAAVDLRNRLGELTGVELAVDVVYDHPTPAEVAGHLAAELA